MEYRVEIISMDDENTREDQQGQIAALVTSIPEKPEKVPIGYAEEVLPNLGSMTLKNRLVGYGLIILGIAGSIDGARRIIIGASNENYPEAISGVIETAAGGLTTIAAPFVVFDKLQKIQAIRESWISRLRTRHPALLDSQASQAQAPD